MTRLVLLVLFALAACGAKQPTQNGQGSAEPIGVVKDTRTPIERRRDAACDQLGPKLTQCALEDAKRDFASGKVSKADFDKDTDPGLLNKHTEKWLKGCKVEMSSRQVRVLEVCYKEETECDPLADCLKHLQPQKGGTEPHNGSAGPQNGSGAK
jgi:hypothetical protein